MPDYHLLREEPENSGTYVATGEVLHGSLEQAAEESVMRTQGGHGRHAIYVYDAINRLPVQGEAPRWADQTVADISQD